PPPSPSWLSLLAGVAPARGQFPLALGRVGPPGLRLLSAHEADGGDDRVEQAGIEAPPRGPAQLVKQRVRVPPDEVAGAGHPGPAEVACDRGADVGQLLQGGQRRAVPGLWRVGWRLSSAGHGALRNSRGWPEHTVGFAGLSTDAVTRPCDGRAPSP